MPSHRLIFVSAVSNEFHHGAAEQWRDFQSYRDVLKHAFHNLDPTYKVLTQEDLVQGVSGLLQTLEREVAHSLFVVHLVGDLSGEIPQLLERRRLFERHPELLSNIPELRTAIGDGNDVTYTQWELYVALHHDKPVLVFEAEPGAPRSPRFAPTDADEVSQTAHRRRIEMTGHHRGPFQDQGDVARKTIRSFIQWHADTVIDPEQSLDEDVAQAREHQEQIVKQLVEAIKKPDPRAVQATDPANTAAFIAAVRATAAKWRVNMATIIDIAANYDEHVRGALGDRPTSNELYEEAFPKFALGDFTAACFSARRAADVALKAVHQEPDNAPIHRESAEKALLLLHDAANAAADIRTAISALEEAAALIDKEADPVTWADFNQTLARFLLDQGFWDRAEELISEIIDVREEHQGEDHHEVGRVLLLWCTVLNARANYPGMESVAARAERIFAGETPVNLEGLVAALPYRAVAVERQNRFSEAEEILRNAVAIAEMAFGPEAKEIANPLGNLAELLHITNQVDEAESLVRRTLLIDEVNYGADHPALATHLNNLASLLRRRRQFEEAEQMLRRSIAISEKSHRSNHPEIAVPLKNLGELFLETKRLDEAEPVIRRALAIEEHSYGAEHPKVAITLNNLAYLLKYNNNLDEAESVIRRAVAIAEQNYGTDHPDVANPLNTLGLILMDTNRLAEAEPLLRRAVLILMEVSVRMGSEHPNLRKVMSNHNLVLRRMGQGPDAE